jgi:hypothetical protein
MLEEEAKKRMSLGGNKNEVGREKIPTPQKIYL